MKNAWAFLIILLCFMRCSTFNYYSARTLKEGDSAISPGWDNLFLYDNEDKEYIFGLSPSLGYIYGLPYRCELGIRYNFPYVLEGMFRHQLNPESFKSFDISANMHFGAGFHDFNTDIHYIRPGITISKEIKRFQPYAGYYRIIPEYTKADEDDFRINARSAISFGLAFPYKKALIFPEMNYQYSGAGFSDGILLVGVGIRSSLGSEPSSP
ncbi:hypothetical protein JW948_08470 [bacterium]|nr:hypothetical protein [bacterium]